jgi:hypothetical protein
LAALLEGSYEGFMAAVTGASPSAVPRRMSLASYLTGERRFPLWQQKLFMDHAIVDVERRSPDGSSTRIPQVRLDSMLEAGDKVVLREDDAAYRAALRAKAVAAVDYALLAARDDSDDFLNFERLLLDRRGAVVLTDQDFPGSGEARSLEDFVVNVGRGSPLDPAIRDLHLISHASPYFSLQFPLALPAPDLEGSAVAGVGTVSWESIERDPAKLRVADEYLLPAAVRASEPPRLFLRACEMGRAPLLLEKLRQAMNPRLRVHAPMHYLGVQTVGRDPLGGGLFAFQDYFEYMCQVHWIAAGGDLTRDQLLEALRTGGPRKDADNADILPAAWSALVPPEPWDPEQVHVASIRLSFQMPEFRLPDNTRIPSFAGEFPIGGMFRFRLDKNFSVPTTATRAEFDVNPKEAVRAALHAHPNPRSNLSPSHSFPVWRRFRVESLDDFVDTFVSAPTYNAAAGRIDARCTSVLYGVLLPVLASGIAPVNGRRTLAVNYYPDGSKTPAVELMKLTDTKFWATVG